MSTLIQAQPPVDMLLTVKDVAELLSVRPVDGAAWVRVNIPLAS